MKFDLSIFGGDSKRLAIIIVVSMFFGAVWFVLVRAVLYDTATTHYHANFALYINGERELFEEPTFYEEVASCGSEEASPLTRVHMHDLINDVVHVHDASATWGNFFENLGFALGDNVVYARASTYVDGQDGDLTFILNGSEVRSLANKTIGNEDVLLVSYGNEDQAVLQDRYEQIDRSADEYNQTADPSACSGSETYNYWERIKEVLGVS